MLPVGATMLENIPRIDPVLTRLTLGHPMRRDFPTNRLLPRFGVDSWTFRYYQYGVEAWLPSDTERAMQAEIKHSTFSVAERTGSLRRFTHEGRADDDELTNAPSYVRLATRLSAQARMKVEMDIERKLKDFLLASTSYASGHVLNITATNEWDHATNGDSKVDILAQAALIAGKTGLSTSDMTVFLSGPSLEAALLDPVFNAQRATAPGLVTAPTISELQGYWGVKEVWSANPTVPTSATDETPVSLYGDIAIVYFSGDVPAEFANDQPGDFIWAAQFGFNRGTALGRYYTPENTTHHFPWQDYRSWDVINANMAALITNTHS